MVTGIVLAGGKGLRLGRAKALEKINERSFLQRAVDCLSAISQEILVVTSREQSGLISSNLSGAKVIVDVYPEHGALGGIYTGLTKSATFYSLVVACDMPFLNLDLLKYETEVAPTFDAIVPRIGDTVEPLHAVYSQNCLPSIERLLRKGVFGVSKLFPMVRTRYVGEDEIAKFDPDLLSFFNINTQRDFDRAEALMRQKEQAPALNKGKVCR